MCNTLASLLLLAVTSGSPQTSNTGSGSIAGRVTLGGKPMPHITVTMLPKRVAGQQSGTLTNTVTDEEGRFRLHPVAPGGYVLNAFAPGFVGPSDGFSITEPGKIITLAEGESAEGVELALKRGGVITGRILDGNQPLIEASVKLAQLDDTGRPRPSYITNSSMYKTDDRGIYRLYGLPPGRYKVSVGEAGRAGVFTFPRGAYQRTFYPDASEESKAAVIELEDGGEVANVDIHVSSFVKPHSVSGRIIDAQTLTPLAGVRYGYGAVGDDGQYYGSVSVRSIPATSKGEFSIEGLLPGRYAVFAVNEGKADVKSEPVLVDLKDEDISGVEIRVEHGASISGTVVFEDLSVLETSAKLADLVVSVSVQSQTLQPVRTDSPRIKPDGGFYVGGLSPGAATLSVQSVQGERSISLVRMEYNSVEHSAIDLKEGDQLTGVRLILAYGTGVVRGEVKVQTGSVPDGLVVLGHREGLSRTWNAQVDARGRFVLEGMPTGEYELILSGISITKPAKQRVTVTTGGESHVIFNLD